MLSSVGRSILDQTTIPAFRFGEMADADLGACRAMLCQGSKSFHLASRVLPRRVRGPLTALYAFCRIADDAVDIDGTETALADLRARLDRIYDGGEVRDPVERALSATVARFAIPRALLEALLEGLAWDAGERRYDDLSELRAYAARVAGAVGVIATLIMGVRSEPALARAADLGVAMQLTNIARDVGEDARNGRLYLPRSWMREAGFDPDAWLADPVFDERLAAILHRLLHRADELYRRAEQGMAFLPIDCRPGIQAARLIYAEIGREIERRRPEALAGRSVVSSGKKLGLLATAMAKVWPGDGSDAEAPPLPETRFLLDAVDTDASVEPSTTAAAPWWNLDERIGRTIELFARLRQEELLQRAEGRR